MDELIKAVERLQELREQDPNAFDTNRLTPSAVHELATRIDIQRAALEVAINEQRAQRQARAMQLALPGIIDLDEEYTPNIDSDQLDEWGADEDEFPFDEPSAALRFNLTGGPSGPADVQAAVSAVQPSLADLLGDYELSVDSLTADSALLEAPDGVGVVGSAGQVIAAGAVPGTAYTFTVAIDGEPDEPDEPATALADQIANALTDTEAEAGEPVADVDEVAVELVRLDGQELTTQDVTTLVAPTTVAALASMMGAHRVLRVEDGSEPSCKVLILQPHGPSPLDRRALRTGIATFTGTLPFAGLGRIRATARVED